MLRPNDEYSDLHSFIGYEHDEGSWARAMREAQRSPYVVQERVKPARTVFPLMNYGHLEFKEMQVDVQPQAFLGKVAGCSSYVSSSGAGQLFAGFGNRADVHHRPQGLNSHWRAGAISRRTSRSLARPNNRPAVFVYSIFPMRLMFLIPYFTGMTSRSGAPWSVSGCPFIS